jgi:hypothetical protein
MRRVLIVSYYFPPLGGIGSLRALGFAQHLPEFGWEPVVLAPSNGAYFRDPSLSFPADHVIRTRSLELSRFGKRLLAAGGDDVRPATVGPLRSLARELARRWLYFPDGQVGWYPGAVLAGRRRVGEGGFDVIFSSSFPITAHLIARALHRRSGLPWIAEFRDPWSARIRDPRHRRRAERLEHSIAAEASGLVMTSPSWAAEYSRTWDTTVTAIPNGYDHGPPASPPDGELVVCHLGSYEPGRQDLSSVWRAIGSFAARRSAPPVRLRVVGEPSAAMRAELKTCGVERMLEVTGFLAHQEALRHVASASLLLAAGPAQAEGVVGAGIVPAKLFEYLPTGLPILWVGATPNDAASLLAGHAGCRLVEPGNMDTVVEVIEQQAGKRYRRDLAGLSRRDRAQALASLLNSANGVVEVSSAGPKIELP